MADYQVHFSCLLHVGTCQNAEQALDIHNEFLSETAASDMDMRLSEGFLLSVQPGQGGSHLWIQDDAGTGDPECVIAFVRRCAARFGLKGRWGFQYAETCSKPLLDGFGGGAYVLDLATGETLACINTSNWLAGTVGRETSTGDAAI